ncbi:histone deacetylase complex subunit SAP18-like [Sycon ciliatum]|uniref:histone deacetylase complex subunit SAP18-like n=1 Tax=Sycon ciliatum TaxID=27933 RepID=UPI0031F5F468
MADRRRRSKSRSRSRSRSPRRRTDRERDRRSRDEDSSRRNGRETQVKDREGDRQPEAAKPSFSVDREKTCPLLLRVFFNFGRHHRPDDFFRGNAPSDELQIYTWKDATLRELMTLVKEVNQDAQRRGMIFSFASVFPTKSRGIYRVKELGVVDPTNRSPSDSVTLESSRFQIGDYIDVAIIQQRPPNY